MTLRRLLPIFACLALPSLAVAAEPEHAGLAIGDQAPMAKVQMKSTDGRELSIADAAGKKGTLVIFTCNSCPWVKAWEKRTVDLGNTYARKGVGVIAINANDPSVKDEDGYAEMQKRVKQRGIRYPYVVDTSSDVARAFGATRTPEAFLFAADGKLVYHGTIDDNAHQPDKVSHHYLRDALDEMLAGKSIATAETKSLGCGIKFRPTS